MRSLKNERANALKRNRRIRSRGGAASVGGKTPAGGGGKQRPPGSLQAIGKTNQRAEHRQRRVFGALVFVFQNDGSQG